MSITDGMLTPYHWQEGIGHRASYVESRLASGTPVLTLSIPDGVIAFTVRRQARKIYEIYDRLMFSAIGQQSDVEAMRVAAIEFAHQEGYNHSEQDVTIQRVVAALSQPLKRAFGDFNTAPFVVRSMFAEVGDAPAQDAFYLLDFDGDFAVLNGSAHLAGSEEAASAVREGLGGLEGRPLKPEEAIEALKPLWARAFDPEGDKPFEALAKDLTPEVALLRRAPDRQRRFEALLGGGAGG
jgi:proteasome alpha subunit